MKLISKSLLAVLFASVSFAAMANDADFSLRNATGYTIDEVYIGAHSSDSWGRDIMGPGALEAGSTVNITFPHGNGACRFDLKVVYDDKTSAAWSDINLCETEKVTLHYNKSTDVTSATFD